MADTRYLKQRHQTWFFLMAVPRDLRSKFGREKIAQSLKTHDLIKAQQLRWPLVTEYTEYFDRLRTGAPLSLAQIDANALQVYSATLARLEADARQGRRVLGEPENEEDERDPEVIGLELLADHYAEAIEQQDFILVADQIATLEKRSGIVVQPGTEAYSVLGRALLDATYAALRGRLAGLRGEASEPPASFLPSGSINLATLQPIASERPKPRRKGGLVFADVASRFIAERQRDPASKLTEQTKGQYEAAFRLFDSWANQPRLDDIDRRKASDFLDAIASLDPHWGRRAGVKELTFEEIAERFGGRKPGLSSVTVNRYGMALGMVWAYAEDRDGYEGKNPWQRQARKVGNKRGNNETDKRAFKPDEIPKLLSPVIITPKQHTWATALPWITLIGAYSGMRLNEIAELECCDVKEDAGIWLFDLTSAKTEAGVRVVPVHSNILAAGFVEYRNHIRTAQLFPGLKPGGPDKKRSWYLSKRFTIHRRNMGLVDIDKVTGRDRLDFHSLRRSAVTALKHAGIPEHDASEVIGHDHAAVTYGIYPDRQKLTRLKQIVEAIKY